MTDLGLASDLKKYPHIFPPPGFVPIDRNGARTETLAAGLSDTLETISEVGSGMEGWLRLMALVSADFAVTFFTILENDQPMKNYTHLEATIGDTSTPRECFIKLKPNYTYKLLVTGQGGGAVNVTVRWTLFGWYYPLGPEVRK